MRVDIISDISCPFCVLGYYQLQAAAAQTGTMIETHWHPFEINPHLDDNGLNLCDNLNQKYGYSAEECARIQADITTKGAALGFEFRYHKNMRAYNSLRAHQLGYWACENGLGDAMHRALFSAWFTHGRKISDVDVLADEAASIGLDREEAMAVLREERFAKTVKSWIAWAQKQGVRGVPTMIFEGKELANGALGTAVFANLIQQVSAS